MVLVLQNEGLDENNEHNIDMAKFDDIVYDLLEVKKYLENPMVKEVFVVPQEYLPTEDAVDFNPTKGQLISKCLFGAFKSTKKTYKNFVWISALPLKRGRSNQKHYKGSLYH
jgi:hypothetical protein